MSAPDLVKQVRSKLLAVSAITDGLSTYDFGEDEGVLPAIFGQQPAPEDAELPHMVVELASGVLFETRGHSGADMIVDVQVWGEKNHSRAALRDIVWEVFEALHHAELSLTGWDNAGVRARPPRTSPDPQGFPGYICEVYVRLLKQ